MLGCIAIITCLQIHVAKNHIDRNEYILREESTIGRSDITKVG